VQPPGNTGKTQEADRVEVAGLLGRSREADTADTPERLAVQEVFVWRVTRGLARKAKRRKEGATYRLGIG
jgi:hypothetical protein